MMLSPEQQKALDYRRRHGPVAQMTTRQKRRMRKLIRKGWNLPANQELGQGWWDNLEVLHDNSTKEKETQ